MPENNQFKTFGEQVCNVGEKARKMKYSREKMIYMRKTRGYRRICC